ncbi:MAG: Sua5/YciO/YrdC/YwlC family protein [Saprospiraceae bacterium]|nr:Sua5/YciO/YrdC/YwlC family protein [Saprospiraceae bacterium]
MHDSTHLNDIITILEQDGLLLVPSDTTWALVADAYSPTAHVRLSRLKQRDQQRPFNLLVDSIELLKRYVPHIHPRVETLLHYHERPLTVIYDRPANLPPHCIGRDRTVAIRITMDRFLRQIIHELDRPLITTSANLTGQAYPVSYDAIPAEIVEGADHIIRSKSSKNAGEPSVLVRYSNRGELIFLRE